MTCTCTCHPSATITWGLGANGASATVPTWVHMADVPPATDTEPSCCELACYEDPGCACPGCEGQRSVGSESRGTWVGCLLLVAAMVAGYVLGRMVS